MSGRGPAFPQPLRWEDLAARAGRNDKPAILLTAIAAGVLTDPQQIRIGLEDTWTTCEWPGRAADYEVWLYAFEHASTDGHYLEEQELRDRTTLPQTLTVYRAAAEGHELGLSWTTSFDKAYWFATRVGALAGHRHKIFELDAPRDWVLAHYHETRGESEYVIDTNGLSLEDLAEVTPDEWPYRLEREREHPERELADGSTPVLLTMEESRVEQLELMIERLAATQEGSYTRHEAAQVILSLCTGLTADVIAPVLEVVDEVYGAGWPDRHVSRDTLTEAVRKAVPGIIAEPRPGA